MAGRRGKAKSDNPQKGMANQEMEREERIGKERAKKE